jgi:hypothetical protein
LSDISSKAGETKSRTAIREVRKAGKVLFETMQIDGKIYTSIIIGPLRISDYGAKDHAVTISPDGDRFVYYDTTDFDRLRWIKKEYLEGVKDYNGQKVFSFRIDGEKKPLNSAQQGNYEYWKKSHSFDKPAFVSDSIAMLDVKTQLPVYYSDGEVEETYEFLPVPSTPPSIPDNFKIELTHQMQYLRSLGVIK